MATSLQSDVNAFLPFCNRYILYREREHADAATVDRTGMHILEAIGLTLKISREQESKAECAHARPGLAPPPRPCRVVERAWPLHKPRRSCRQFINQARSERDNKKRLLTTFAIYL